MRRFAFILSAALAAVLMLPSDAAATVGFDVGVLWNPDPGSDTQVFLHATNIAYPIPRAQVVPVFNEIQNPYDDYPVLAFIAYNAQVDIRSVWSYRAHDHGWFDVMLHFGVRPDALFVALPHDPGPPYGKAYGYWRKNGNRMKARSVSDDDVRFWVRTRATARYSGVAPARAWEWHQQGRGYEKVTSTRYQEKHGRGQQKQGYSQAGFGSGKGNGSPGNGSGSPGKGNGSTGKGNGKNKKKEIDPRQ
jgi:hypothetical protein